MRRWRIPITLALVALLLALLAAAVSSQGGATLTFSEEEWYIEGSVSISDGILETTWNTGKATYLLEDCAGAGSGRIVFYSRSITVPPDPWWFAQTARVWANTTNYGSIVVQYYDPHYTDGSWHVFDSGWVELDMPGDAIVESMSVDVRGVAGTTAEMDWIQVEFTEGTCSGPAPEPTPDTGCINDDPELESGGADWVDIGSPDWLTGTVVLDQGDGFYQVVDLQPGAYTVHITATNSPENLDYKPITVSLGYTETAQRVEIWGVEYVDFAISEAGTYTLTVESDYDDPEYDLELGRVCLMSVSCINEDHNLQVGLPDWYEINTPTWLTSTNGVQLDYLDGIGQSIALPAGSYRLEISATLTPGFPEDRAFVEMCLGAGCATVPIAVGGNTSAQFNVLSGGSYAIEIANASTSRLFPINTITLTYACLNPIDYTCMVIDPSLDAVSMPGAAGQQGWTTVDEGVAQPGGAEIGCEESVQQWVYLQSGSYTGTLHAHSSFIFDDPWSEPYPVSGTLTIRLGPEDDPFNEYRDYLLPIHSVGLDPDFGMAYLNRVYTFAFQIPETGNYLLSFENYDCRDSFAETRGGAFRLDYVCLVDQSGGVPGLGYCASLIDAGFQEYEAAHWDTTSGVTWSPGYVTLAEGAAISQTVSYSTTEQAWVVYAVAKSSYTTTLGLALGANVAQVTVTPDHDFTIYTATITSSMPISVALSALTGTVDLDFVCVYDPDHVPGGEWDNGIDGDTECIEPDPIDWSNISILDLVDAVARILKFIWQWIVYLICLMVLWLRRIWLALSHFLRNVFIDLGLDAFFQNLIAWLVSLLQGPYDVAKLGEYVLNLMFDLAARAFGLLFAGATLAFLFFSSILVGLALLGSLLAGFWAAIASPCEPASYQVSNILVQGFLLVERTITQIGAINTLQYLIIGVMGLSVVLWTISQFKTMTGGGD